LEPFEDRPSLTPSFDSLTACRISTRRRRRQSVSISESASHRIDRDVPRSAPSDLARWPPRFDKNKPQVMPDETGLNGSPWPFREAFMTRRMVMIWDLVRRPTFLCSLVALHRGLTLTHTRLSTGARASRRPRTPLVGRPADECRLHPHHRRLGERASLVPHRRPEHASAVRR
jgi:hypothetical protein